MKEMLAAEKIGGQFEGTLRKDILRDNNTHRNSAYYSIIDSEWAEKKQFDRFVSSEKKRQPLTISIILS